MAPSTSPPAYEGSPQTTDLQGIELANALPWECDSYHTKRVVFPTLEVLITQTPTKAASLVASPSSDTAFVMKKPKPEPKAEYLLDFENNKAFTFSC